MSGAQVYIEREAHFFGTLVDKLKLRDDVKDLCPVMYAKVPLIKMVFMTIDIDLLFARIERPVIEETLTSLKDDSVLKNCDEASILSLNGNRVTDMILELVQDKENFRITLRCIKLWAK